VSAPLPSPSPLPPWLERRPTKRAECPPPDQQCPWASCRYHLALDVRKQHRLAKQARITYNLPPDPEDWPADAQTCALHLADDGPRTLEQLGAVMGDISRERVRQIEQSAADKLSQFGIVLELAEDMDLDTDTRARNNQRPSAEAKGHRDGRIRATDPDLDGTYTGPFRSQDMTAKMRRIQAESAPPARTLSPDDIDLVALAEDLDRKRQGKPAPLGQRRSFVALDTFTQRAENTRATERYARSKESLRSFRRLQADTAPTVKAPTTTQPRLPSPPSPPPIEIPPQVLPATTQADDQPEVAVVSALPDPQPPQPAPPIKPMSLQSPRSTWATQQAFAIGRINAEMAERRMSLYALAMAVASATPQVKVTSVETSVRLTLAASNSPITIWFRRIAAALGLELSDLCDDPAWVAEIQQEDGPRMVSKGRAVAAPLPPAEPAISPKITPLFEALTLAQNQLSHVAGAAAHLEARAEDLEALAKVLRDEIADLQEQLAERTRERDSALDRLAKIKAAL
jgi:hypothetical protein